MVVQPHHCGPVARQNFMLGSIGHSKAIRAKLSPHGFLGSRERAKERERERERKKPEFPFPLQGHTAMTYFLPLGPAS
jgi:hypothetical protein